MNIKKTIVKRLFNVTTGWTPFCHRGPPHPIRVSIRPRIRITFDTRALITRQKTFTMVDEVGRIQRDKQQHTVKTENAKVFSSEAFDCNGVGVELEGRPWCRFLCRRGSKHRGSESSVEKTSWKRRILHAASGSLSNSCSHLFNQANEWALENFAIILWLISIILFNRREGGERVVSQGVKQGGLRRICKAAEGL